MHYFEDTIPPKLLRHIEDRDLWRFKLEGTRQIQAALFSYPYDFKVWDKLMYGDDNLFELRKDGTAIERKHFKDINELIKACQHVITLRGYTVPALNAPYFYSSDAGHIMAKGHPFALCYYYGKNDIKFSLRSNDDGVDVSEIAKHYGGGGHHNAAGFELSSMKEL